MPLRTSLCIVASLALVAAGAVGTPTQAGSSRVTVLRGTIDGNVTLKPTRTNVIDGVVVVGSGSTLRIRPGTTVLAGAASALVVERGGLLIADGTPELPIVFTSAQPEAQRRRGDWGGVVINGAAPVGDSVLTTDPQDGTGAFGGTDVTNSSGVLRCVRVEYAGFPKFGPDRLAAIGLRGVGSGTVVDRVQAINGDGDGIAVVGGAVAVARVAAVGCSGSGLSATAGWTGTAQFVLSLVRGDLPAQTAAGIDLRECSATIANATIIGAGAGLRVSGDSGSVFNLVVARCRGGGLETRDSATTAASAQGLDREHASKLEAVLHHRRLDAHIHARAVFVIDVVLGVAGLFDDRGGPRRNRQLGLHLLAATQDVAFVLALGHHARLHLEALIQISLVRLGEKQLPEALRVDIKLMREAKVHGSLYP